MDSEDGDSHSICSLMLLTWTFQSSRSDRWSIRWMQWSNMKMMISNRTELIVWYRHFRKEQWGLRWIWFILCSRFEKFGLFLISSLDKCSELWSSAWWRYQSIGKSRWQCFCIFRWFAFTSSAFQVLWCQSLQNTKMRADLWIILIWERQSSFKTVRMSRLIEQCSSERSTSLPWCSQHQLFS